ncbi:MAG: imidazolonepropionase [Acidimicrobiia bacterium]
MSLLLTGIGELVTNAAGSPDLVGSINDAALAVDEGTVVWFGQASELPDDLRDSETLDCEGRAVLPGFVDCHTHLVFAGDRANEFARRLGGESYEDILAAGGGIHSTVAATAAAPTPELTRLSTDRALRMLGHGTTTVEIKSGYGLETQAEVRMLEVAAEIGCATPLDVVTTFLGAHVVPTAATSEDYVRLIVDEMLPACAPLARSCDVFCDEGAFSVDEARTILMAARHAGLELRLHAEQLAHTGATQLAAELGAASADHLDNATAADAAALAAAGTVGVLLPGASLGRAPAPARLLAEAGVTLAVATDCNPGTSNVESMPLIVALAVHEMGLSPAEATWAATRGGATALGLDDRGHISASTVADLVVLDAPSHVDLSYRPGSVEPWRVLKAGVVL